MERQRIDTGTRWEEAVGYSRAVRVGDTVYVTGTTAWDETGAIVGVGDAYLQAQQVLRNIGNALEKAGASFTDVVRTRIYVTDIGRDGEAVGRAHREVFGSTRPCATMVQVCALMSPECLVEIEADAVIVPPAAE